MMILTSTDLNALGWCLLGYMFLGLGESGYAIVASMAAITTATLARSSHPAGT